ncbi:MULTISPECIES: hypothetical protein [Pseudomonas]|uniref:Uncharacterized protein n=1 Tax=Pseudomonas fluorescens TaxID=294 RepID=A0A162BHX5_PSEFL|nr:MULTISPECIES: hypothetical protein [Pseudomonas]KZN15923.1 hypothetical protein A1D17_07015 [Pseudomonas fluorescens]
MRWTLVLVLAFLALGYSKPPTFEQVETMPAGAARIGPTALQSVLSRSLTAQANNAMLVQQWRGAVALS